MTRSVAVIGLGRFGAALATDLTHRGVEVIAIDVEERRVLSVHGEVHDSSCVDSRDARALERAGVAAVDVAVVAIGENFEAVQETVLALRQIGVEHVVARAQTEDRRRILERVGADEVLSPEIDNARRVAHSLTNPLIRESFELAFGGQVSTMVTPAGMVGKTLAEIGATAAFGVLVVRVLRKSASAAQPEVLMPPGAATKLESGDELTVVGPKEGIRRFAAG